MNELLRFHRDKASRGLRFKRHQAREKALDRICKDLAREAGRETFVGFGDWSNNDPGGIIKGHRSGPVRALVRRLRRYCIVISIDEHRTSMLHHVCHEVLVGQRVEIKDKRGLVWLRESCSAQYCEACYDAVAPGCYRINRDYNAVWSMLMLTEKKLYN